VVTGALAAGCGVAATRAPTRDTQGEVDAFVTDLDAALASIDASRPLAKIKHKLPPERVARDEQFIKTSLRALLIAGSLRDLPEEAQVHPEVQRRVWAAMLDMDTAVFDARARLDALGREDHKRIQEALSRDDKLEDGIFSELDRAARDAGVSLKRRTHLRTLAKHICGRLRQSPELAIAEFGKRVDRVVARGTTANESMLTPALFHVSAQASGAASANPCVVPCGSAPSVAGSVSSTGPEATVPGITKQELKRLVNGAVLDGNAAGDAMGHPKPAEKPGSATLTAGATLLGISAGVFVGGLLITATGTFAGLFVATAGAVGILIGVIVAIIGAIQSAVS